MVIHLEFDIPPHNKQIMNGSISLTKWIDDAYSLYYNGVDFSNVSEPKGSIEDAFIRDDVIKEYRLKLDNTCGSYEDLVQLIETAEKFNLVQGESFEKLKAIKESNNAETIEYIEVLPEAYSLPEDSAEFNNFFHEDTARYIMKLLYLSQPLKDEDVEFINVALRTGEEDVITMDMISNSIEADSTYWDGTHDLLPRMTSYSPVYDLARVKMDFHNGKYDEMPAASFGVWSKYFNSIRSSFVQLTKRDTCEKYSEELDAFERRYSERYYSDLTTITSQMMGMYK